MRRPDPRRGEPAANAGRPLAPALGAVTFALAAGAAATVVLARSPALRQDLVSLVTVGLVYPAVGTAVARRHPRNAVGWIFCLFGAVYSLLTLAIHYATIGLHTRPGSLPGAALMAWLSVWLWPVAIGLLAPLPLLLFPDGRLPSRRWRIVLASTVAGVVLAAVPLAALTWGARGPDILDNPGTLSPALDRAFRFAIPGFLVLVGSTVGALVALLVRLRRARGIERQQLRLFTLAITLVVVLLLVNAAGLQYPELVLDAAMALVPVAAGVAILRHGLFDLDLVINRSLVYAGVTGSLLLSYVAVVSALGAIVDQPVELGPQLAATAVVAVLFAPLSAWLQGAVNRAMFGRRDNPYVVISRLGERLEAAPAGIDALRSIVESVREELRLPYVAIELVVPSPAGVRVASGHPPDETERFALLHQGQELGWLVAGTRGDGLPFSSTERALLRDLARRAGAAADAVRLTAELQRSRERLVVAREEERRRLRRELHDNLGPALAAIRLELAEAARHASDADVAVMVESARTELARAVADVRRLAYELRPPALDEVGLVGAVRQRAEELAMLGDRGEMAISVTGEGDLARVSAAAEVAAYRIAVEAIANAVRHSGAQYCAVRLAVDDELRLEVVDDGRGLATGWRPGVGVTAMRERAAEVGGTLVVDGAGDGGTVVQARLPLVVPAA